MKQHLNPLIKLIKRHSVSVIVIPWLIYAFYLVLIASPQYESQSKLIVKSSNNASSFDPTSLIPIIPGNAGGTEVQIVAEFIKSADMLNYLNDNIDLAQHYASSKGDIFSRLSSDYSFESFYQYYSSHVNVRIDSVSGVIVIKSTAFTPEYAREINLHIIERAEQFINEINNNLAKSRLSFATREHENVVTNLQGAKAELLAFQQKYDVLDPTAEGAAFQQIAFTLEATLAQKKAQLVTLRSMMSSQAPDVLTKEREIAALETQITAQKSRITTGEGQDSVSQLMARYSNLKVQMQLALQAYTASLVTLENARVETYQQLQHLVTIESPTQPQDNAYPEVLYNLSLFAIILIGLFGITRLAIATIRELD